MTLLALAERAAGLNAARNRLAGAAEAERGAVAAVDELSKAERAAMLDWLKRALQAIRRLPT